MRSSSPPIRRLGLAVVPVVLALIVPATALGQATRTWVSGVGDDANPCSRTAPCHTFAGAISKTAAGGEINVLDPGGFGAVTITKSLTIEAVGMPAGVLVNAGNGITINAGVTDSVTLSGLDIDGVGATGASTAGSGVSILTAGNVRIENSQIYGFKNAGVQITPSASNTQVQISNDRIYSNAGVGVLVAPTGTGRVRATISNSDIQNNLCGVVAGSYGASLGSSTNCSLNTGTGAGAKATVEAVDSTVSDNTTVTGSAGSAGFSADGASAVIRISRVNVIGNVVGLATADAGTITSYGNNILAGNSFTGAPTPPSASSTARHRSSRSAKHAKTHRKSKRRARTHA